MTQQRPLGLGTHIFVPDPGAAVAFYRAAFGATELIRHDLPDGRILFVELAFGPDKLSGASASSSVISWLRIVRDPFSHRWALCSRRELLAPDEVAERVPSQEAEIASWADARLESDD